MQTLPPSARREPARCRTRLVVAIRLKPHSSGYLDKVPAALEFVPSGCAVRLIVPGQCWGASHQLLDRIAEAARTAAGIQIDCSDPESPAVRAILAVLAGAEPLAAVGVR